MASSAPNIAYQALFTAREKNSLGLLCRSCELRKKEWVHHKTKKEHKTAQWVSVDRYEPGIHRSSFLCGGNTSTQQESGLPYHVNLEGCLSIDTNTEVIKERFLVGDTALSILHCHFPSIQQGYVGVRYLVQQVDQ